MTHVHSKHLLLADPEYQPATNRLLHSLGHFAVTDEDGFALGGPTYDEVATLGTSDKSVRAAVESYQKFRPWLKIDGKFGECTHTAAMQEIGCRCGCPDVMHARGTIAEWPEACQLNVTTAHNLYGLRTQLGDGRDMDDAWYEALSRWNAVCGVKLVVVGMGEDPRISARVGSMGAGTLAWSYLADGDCRSRLRQEYNRSITWNWHKIVNVSAHELGHALGLPHTSQANNLMLPYYSPSFDGLGEWDISQVNAKRYGPPANTPAPGPQPPVDPPAPQPPARLPTGGILTLTDDAGNVVMEFDQVPRAKG